MLHMSRKIYRKRPEEFEWQNQQNTPGATLSSDKHPFICRMLITVMGDE